MVTKQIVKLGGRVFNAEGLHRAYTKTVYPETPLYGASDWTAFALLQLADKLGVINELGSLYAESLPKIPKDGPPDMIYNPFYLNRKLDRVYDLPEVKVVDWRQPTINVMVPAFDFQSISAGFFGVFQIARFLRSTGMPVRLVLFDTFVFSEKEARERIKGYHGLEDMFDELEVEYIGEREKPLYVSSGDYNVATVWYSAYFARKVNEAIGRSKFLYLIQDYETVFHPANSMSTLADATYGWDYDALFSTKSLMDMFIKKDIGGYRTRGLRGIYFENACSSNLLPEFEFIARHMDKPKKSLVFYSRPVVNRNMFELTALALCEAYAQGIFDPEEWDCIGMGLGEGVVEILPGVYNTKLPRMTLKEYTDAITDFDVCLTLMASPHPSLIPMDLGGSGAVVVTNTFETKTPEYLESLNGNIIPVAPDLHAIVDGLREAVERSKDLVTRWQNAHDMQYPRTWEETFSERHREFVKRWVSENENADAKAGGQ